MVHRVILDVDPGVDDAWAILTMLHAEKEGKVKVEGITLVNGNSTLENVAKNTLRVLHAANRLDIPVYRGCHEPLIVPEKMFPDEHENFHFNDGFGDVEFDYVPDMSLIKEQHAVQAMHEIITSASGGSNNEKVSLMCLGPLTNYAMLLKLYPGISECIDSIWLMGGNRHGIGNVTNSAEFNFHCDPEAAFIVFQCTKCPIYMLPLETVAQTHPKIPMQWRYDEIGSCKNKVTELLDPVEKKCFEAWNDDCWAMYDTIVAVCFIHRNCMKRISEFHVTVELGGNHTRGQAVLDHKQQKKKNTTIIEEYDVQIFQNVILKTIRNF